MTRSSATSARTPSSSVPTPSWSPHTCACWLSSPPRLPGNRPRACPSAGLTAYQAIKRVGVRAGDTVLVHAAAGGVGSLGVQIAVALGARVIGTASVLNHDYVRQLGAEPVTYGTGLVDRVAQLAPGESMRPSTSSVQAPWTHRCTFSDGRSGSRPSLTPRRPRRADTMYGSAPTRWVFQSSPTWPKGEAGCACREGAPARRSGGSLAPE